MARTLSRELILPALRLAVPPRPTGQQLAALSERSPDVWTLGARELATQQVVRLAVAELLRVQVVRSELATDLDHITVGQVAPLFRPHVDLGGQALRIALIEAVNAGVPAAVDPLREGLKHLGITGREPLRMVALGLDRVPARAGDFWTGAKTSSTLTAVLDALVSGARGDLSTLDRRHLNRAHALVSAAGRVTPVVVGAPVPDPGGSWLDVPLALTRRQRNAGDGRRPAGPSRGIEVALGADGWTEVFEAALDVVGGAMSQMDGGPRARARTGLTSAMTERLVSARGRTVGDVIASLRAVDPFVLELFDHQVTSSEVRVSVPVLEDDRFADLWLSSSALAGPLVTGAVDLFLGGASETRRAAVRGGPTQGGPGKGGEGKGGSGKGGAGKGGAARKGPRPSGSRPPRRKAPAPRPSIGDRAESPGERAEPPGERAGPGSQE